MGAIGGAGFTGFCFGIIIGGFLTDKLGYGKLVLAAFALHVLSAVVTFMPNESMTAGTVYSYLLWGMFIFAAANGVLEAVSNPLVATLFPEKRTHYLNILHASWPAGLVLGGLCGWYLDDLQLCLFRFHSIHLRFKHSASFNPKVFQPSSHPANQPTCHQVIHTHTL